MRVKIQLIGEGLHPSEVVVEVKTVDGEERLVVDKHSIQGNSLSVGWPIATKKTQYLIELPRETMRGTWRVWVRKNQVLPEGERVAAE